MNENTNTLTQEEVNNKEVLEASAEKLAVIASKLAEIFKAGFDAGFIGAKTTALLETYKQEAKKYVNEQLDLIVKGENSDGILNTIKEIGDALNNNANAFNVLMDAVNSAKAEANKKVPMSFDENYYTLYGNDKKGKVRLWKIFQTLTSDDYATSILSSIVARDSNDGYAYTITPVDNGNPTGKELMRIANVKYVLEKIEANKTEVNNYIDDALKSARDTIIGDGTIGLAYRLNASSNNVTCTGIGNAKETSIKIAEHILGIPVSDIAYKAFYGLTSLLSVDFGNTSSVGISAFEGCTGLMTIYGRGANIGGRAFYGCKNLRWVSLGEGAIGIGDNAFCNCTSLTSVTIPDSVISIAQEAFLNCTSLTSIIIPDNVTFLGGSTFYGCKSLETVTI